MMISFMLTDSEKPIRICRHLWQAGRVQSSAVHCKNRYNVYKSKTKKSNPTEEGQTDG